MSNLLSTKNQKKTQCPWSTSLSREYVDRIKGNLYPPPPIGNTSNFIIKYKKGHYRPKYD